MDKEIECIDNNLKFSSLSLSFSGRTRTTTWIFVDIEDLTEVDEDFEGVCKLVRFLGENAFSRALLFKTMLNLCYFLEI